MQWILIYSKIWSISLKCFLTSDFVQVRMAPHRWHWRISQCSALSQHAQCFTLVMQCLLREPWSLQLIQRCVIVSTYWSSVDKIFIILAREVNLLFFDSMLMPFPAFRVSVSSAPADLTMQSYISLERNLNLAKPRWGISKNKDQNTLLIKSFIVSIFSYKLQQGRINLASMLNFVILV